MYIKQVNINGFRSYRDTSIDNFSRAHNVIVGRNGSGKSNFFFAIQFVLSDEFCYLKLEQRQGLIHEGTGDRVMSARVEIVFDNTDRRIAAVEGDEVRVVRQLSHKKDQYFIDSKTVTRNDVVNLMESAGFSRSNPYYIVKQGKINELATSPDSHRLKLLKEVAGTRVYDERKEESLKILHETEVKSEKIDALLEFIEERLKTLEEEKEDLKEYQKWDKMKRSVEFTMYNAEMLEARKKLDKLAQQREELNASQSRVANQLLEAQNRALKASTEQRRLEAKFKGMKEEKEALLAEQNERFEKKTELELLIKDLREDVEKERSGRDRAEDVLSKLMGEIAAKEEELREVVPKYNQLQQKEVELNTDIRISDQRCKELYAKQGYQEQYRTVEERDKVLLKEIRFYDRIAGETEDQIEDIKRSLQEQEQEEQQLNTKIMELGVQLDELVYQMGVINEEIAAKRRDLDQAIIEQQDAARGEKVARDNLEAIRIEVNQAEQQMKQITPRSVINGVESVQKVLKTFRESNSSGQNDTVLNGYHGTLIELFHCDEAYNTAVEVTAGTRLFYHVVDNDRVALRILKEVNAQRLMGEVNFFPLNRLVVKNRGETRDEGARPMLSILEYDPIYDDVMRHVFGGTAIVRTMEVGNRLSKAEGLDCVTLEGDQISKGGAMTGGYIDIKRSRLELHSKYRQLLAQQRQRRSDLDNAILKNNQKTSNVEKMRIECQNKERKAAELKISHKTATEKKRYITEQVNQSAKNRGPKESQCIVLRNRLREVQANKDGLRSQLGTPLLSQLSPEDSLLLERLQNEIREKKAALESVTRERLKLESIKQRLENQLSTNLLKKRESLQAKIQDISVDEKSNNLQSEMAELESANHRLSEIIKRLGELSGDLTGYEQSRETLTRELEDIAEQQKDLEAQMAEFSKQADLICTKQSALQSKREESIKKIRELGSLPMDVQTYENYSLKQLEKKLNEALEKLKKYEHVNKKALDQFVQASDQKEDLTKRRDEHRQNQKAISDLLNVLDQRKYEAIQLTFKQVSKNFQTVFNKLVPSGYGSLIMRTAQDDSESQSSGRSALPIIETFTGVGIKVSFTGSSETMEMQQLSGGQKSLVALALIFAIQKCDPAPFYLFDEIDAALDAQHRKAVADMIHELSQNAQFITTTFRAELLGSAEKYFGVRFRNKVSHIDPVTKEQAYDFVEDDQTHG